MPNIIIVNVIFDLILKNFAFQPFIPEVTTAEFRAAMPQPQRKLYDVMIYNINFLYAIKFKILQLIGAGSRILAFLGKMHGCQVISVCNAICNFSTSQSFDTIDKI